MKTKILVNRNLISQNKSKGTKFPVISVKANKRALYGNTVDILDENNKIIASIKYRPDSPLSCGAVVWIETENKVQIENAVKFEDLK